MLNLRGSNWIKKDQMKTRILEYRGSDFYGPFVVFYLEQNKSGSIKAIPISSRIETAEVSEDHFTMLSKATKEIYKEFGEFTLKTKFFEVKINSEETEQLILNKLRSMSLF